MRSLATLNQLAAALAIFLRNSGPNHNLQVATGGDACQGDSSRRCVLKISRPNLWCIKCDSGESEGSLENVRKRAAMLHTLRRAIVDLFSGRPVDLASVPETLVPYRVIRMVWLLIPPRQDELGGLLAPQLVEVHRILNSLFERAEKQPCAENGALCLCAVDMVCCAILRHKAWEAKRSASASQTHLSCPGSAVPDSSRGKRVRQLWNFVQDELGRCRGAIGSNEEASEVHYDMNEFRIYMSDRGASVLCRVYRDRWSWPPLGLSSDRWRDQLRQFEERLTNLVDILQSQPSKDDEQLMVASLHDETQVELVSRCPICSTEYSRVPSQVESMGGRNSRSGGAHQNVDSCPIASEESVSIKSGKSAPTVPRYCNTDGAIGATVDTMADIGAKHAAVEELLQLDMLSNNLRDVVLNSWVPMAGESLQQKSIRASFDINLSTSFVDDVIRETIPGLCHCVILYRHNGSDVDLLSWAVQLRYGSRWWNEKGEKRFHSNALTAWKATLTPLLVLLDIVGDTRQARKLLIEQEPLQVLSDIFIPEYRVLFTIRQSVFEKLQKLMQRLPRCPWRLEQDPSTIRAWSSLCNKISRTFTTRNSWIRHKSILRLRGKKN